MLCSGITIEGASIKCLKVTFSGRVTSNFYLLETTMKKGRFGRVSAIPLATFWAILFWRIRKRFHHEGTFFIRTGHYGRLIFCRNNLAFCSFKRWRIRQRVLLSLFRSAWQLKSDLFLEDTKITRALALLGTICPLFVSISVTSFSRTSFRGSSCLQNFVQRQIILSWDACRFRL